MLMLRDFGFAFGAFQFNLAFMLRQQTFAHSDFCGRLNFNTYLAFFGDKFGCAAHSTRIERVVFIAL